MGCLRLLRVKIQNASVSAVPNRKAVPYFILYRIGAGSLPIDGACQHGLEVGIRFRLTGLGAI